MQLSRMEVGVENLPLKFHVWKLELVRKNEYARRNVKSRADGKSLEEVY